VVLALNGTPVVSKLYLMIYVSEKLSREQKIKLCDPNLLDSLVTTDEKNHAANNQRNLTHKIPPFVKAAVVLERTIRLYETRR
jgi:hypothetical protein